MLEVLNRRLAGLLFDGCDESAPGVETCHIAQGFQGVSEVFGVRPEHFLNVNHPPLIDQFIEILSIFLVDEGGKLISGDIKILAQIHDPVATPEVRAVFPEMIFQGGFICQFLLRC
jgi:hypothetical protein